ncbi:MAG: DUF6279 family lipoprotein [Burkholderiaceae bacterium]
MSALLSNAVSGRAARGLAFVFVLLLGACSAIRIGYNNADTLIVFSLDDYLDLSSEQSDLARERAGALMNWHRSTQLRDYAQVIDAARAKLAGPVTATEVLAFNEAINNRLAAVGDRAAPDLAQLALTLSQAQLDQLTRKLTSDTSKARRELVKFAGKESIDDRVKRYAERVDDWFGSVSPVQREALRTALLQRPAAAEWWIEERERRQRELVRVLRRIQSEQPSVAVATGWLRDYFAELRSSPDPQRRAKMDEFRRSNAELIATLINSASPAQRAHLSAKLGGYAEDFSALAESRLSQPG